MIVSAFAQDISAKHQPVETVIEKVTVFLNGAQVTRKGKTALPSGRSMLIFKQISPNIDKQSIQLKGDGAFTILSVTHQVNHLETQVKREEIAKLESVKYQQQEE